MSSTTGVGTCDEVFDSDGTPRPHAEQLVAELERLGAESLVAAGALRDAIFVRQASPSTSRPRTARSPTAPSRSTSCRGSIASGEFPHLEQIVRAAPSTREAIAQFEALMRDEGRFDSGLARLLDGIAIDLDSRQ